MEKYMKYGVGIIVIIIVAVAIFYATSPKTNSVKPQPIITHSIATNLSNVKSTFNLSSDGSKILFGNATYADAIDNSSYISSHELDFYDFYSSISNVININKYYGGSSIELNLTKNSKINISKSYSSILINIQGNFAYIIITGSHDKIYLANGPYVDAIGSSAGAVNDTITVKDAYRVQ